MIVQNAAPMTPTISYSIEGETFKETRVYLARAYGCFLA